MTSPTTEYIDHGTIDLPDDPLSPLGILVEVPTGTTNPSEVQLRRIAHIRLDAPRLWNVGMTELQRHFDEKTNGRGSARDGIIDTAVTIHETNEDETDDDFFWNLVFAVKEEVPEQFWEVPFNWGRFERVLLFLE